jgi:hypothetical protein
MRVTRTVVTAIGAFAVAAAVAVPATALQPGVYVSPGSPAGKEYGIPLDVQRAAALGQTAPQGVAQPLFGVGITSGSLGGNASSLSSGSRGSSARRGRTPNARGLAPGALALRGGSARGPALGSAAITSLTRSGSTVSETALLAIPVVLGGLLAGATIAIARRRRLE